MINVDSEKLSVQSQELKSNLYYYDQVGAPIVEEYSKDLDEKVDAIKNYLAQIRQYNLEFDIPSLQKILIDLSTTIYYTNDKLEKLGLLEDMSKIRFKDKYNEVYTSKQEATTVDKRKWTAEQLRAVAEQEAIEEALINFIYTHATAVLKSKIDSANEILKAVSKILSSKIQEMSSFGIQNKYSN